MVCQVIFNVRIHGERECEAAPAQWQYLYCHWHLPDVLSCYLGQWWLMGAAVVSRRKPLFPVPLMQTPAAPTNPHHSTNFGTIHHSKSDLAIPSHGDGGGRPSSVMSLGVASVGGHSHGHPASLIGVGSLWEDIDPRSPEPLVVRGGWLWLIWVVRWTT